MQLGAIRNNDYQLCCMTKGLTLFKCGGRLLSREKNDKQLKNKHDF